MLFSYFRRRQSGRLGRQPEYWRAALPVRGGGAKGFSDRQVPITYSEIV